LTYLKYINSNERFDLLACACVHMCQVFTSNALLIFKVWKAAKRQFERQLSYYNS